MIGKKLGAICVALIMVIYYKTFIFTAIPPQYGWFNYYGWQLATGANIYSDIYCFLPPGFPWLCMILYKIIGNDIFLYYCLGIGVSVITSVMVYIVVCRLVSPVCSLICTIIGSLITCGFVPHLPFDYNPVLQFIVVLAAFFLSDNTKNKKKYFIAGILLGISILFKQTAFVYVIIVLTMLWYFNYKNDTQEIFSLNLRIIILGIMVVILPVIIYFYATDTLFLAVQEISHASVAKGVSESPIDTLVQVVKRFYKYGFSAVIILLAVFLCLKSLVGDEIRNSQFKPIYSVLNYTIFLLIIFKIVRCFQMVNYNNYNLLLVVIIVNYFFWILYTLKDLVFIREKINILAGKICEFHKLDLLIPIGMIMLISLVYLFGFDYITAIYYNGITDAFRFVKRSISDISFWWSLFICFWIAFIKHIKDINDSLWVFIVVNLLFQCTIFLSTGSLDETFSLATVSFSLAYLVRNKNLKRYVYLCLICAFVIVASVAQKQLISYTWHGWACTGLNNPGVTYVDSRVPGLSGFTLDKETELAYENITDAIQIYSSTSDIVYEFPHITLFNVLCDRKLGTFAVAHFFDVCPDDVFEKDFRMIKNHDPKMFIWMDLDENIWKVHEDLFRGGRSLSARKLIIYYDDYIKNNYKLVYSYRNIFVWVKNPTQEENDKFRKKMIENEESILLK